ncbi:hypothetical protein CVIRNUC_007261 [Coccomyxa viridis]|uniref:Dynein axonemal assembly factor 11-like CS domain-containing protein n=1 Tax=Coccomyxa viridis TaxID=1274662 RepID=A0AAV1IA30_9CHLO|nr:hypothetical protein CVIRNUC_007261 [Coccomyxa viridis]
MQKNEGQWQFSLDDSSDGRSIEFAVAVCRYLDTSLIRADVQPRFVRLLIQGKLLQLELPAEVKPSLATAQRSNATGNLLLTMPKEHPDAAHYDEAKHQVANA